MCPARGKSFKYISAGVLTLSQNLRQGLGYMLVILRNRNKEIKKKKKNSTKGFIESHLLKTGPPRSMWVPLRTACAKDTWLESLSTDAYLSLAADCSCWV